jgi:hypothetical protein
MRHKKAHHSSRDRAIEKRHPGSRLCIDKRELKCAFVGGDSKAPLGFISLTENLMMVAMRFWMAVP